MSIRFCGTALAALLSASAAAAQSTTPAPTATAPATPEKPKPAAKATGPQDVTVTAKRPDYQSAIDRRSYSVANDLQKTTGSLADALRNVPQVEVDVQGNVKLRGDSNVTILIDGKPSPLFQGPQRADILQQLPADQIERVEVITTPSAEFRPDGTGGIINLITKKGGAQPVFSTSFKANVGNDGRYNLGVSVAKSEKGLTLTFNGGFRHDASGYESHDRRQLLGAGSVANVTNDSLYKGHSDTGYASGGLQYQIDAKTRLNPNLTGFSGHYGGDFQDRYRSDALTGPFAQDYDQNGVNSGRYAGVNGGATLTRTLPGEDHEVSVHLSLSEFNGRFGNKGTYSYQLPVQPNLYQDISDNNPQRTAELKVEYKTPLPGKAKLVTGYQFNGDWDAFDHRVRTGTSAADASDPTGRSNIFKLGQQVHALYLTYQQPFGAFTLMPGLRLEDTILDLDQTTSRATDSYDYFRAYPTLHAAYKIDGDRTLTFGFSRRVQRPGGQALNPYRVYYGPLSYSQGNSRLKPEVTNAYELAYEYRHRATYYLATLFYRDYEDSFTQITQDLGGGAVLQSQANLGSSRTTGVEVVANGALLKTLSYNVSGTALYREIDAANLGISGTRSGTRINGRASLNWTITPKDFAQITVSAGGRELTAQGHNGASYSANLGFRHKFDDKLALVMTAQNPFYNPSRRNDYRTPTLVDSSTSRFRGQSVYIGFSYALGAQNKRAPEQFDFGGAAVPGGGGPH